MWLIRFVLFVCLSILPIFKQKNRTRRHVADSKPGSFGDRECTALTSNFARSAVLNKCWSLHGEYGYDDAFDLPFMCGNV